MPNVTPGSALWLPVLLPTILQKRFLHRCFAMTVLRMEVGELFS